jgi:hypothetical protein
LVVSPNSKRHPFKVEPQPQAKAREEMSPPQLDEAKLRKLIEAEFASADGNIDGVQRAVQGVMMETGLSAFEARWLVMRLRNTDG